MRVPFLSLLSLALLAFAVQAADPPPAYKVNIGEALTLKVTLPEPGLWAKWQVKGFADAVSSDNTDPLHLELTFTGVKAGCDVLWIATASGAGHVWIEVVDPKTPPKPKSRPIVEAPTLDLHPEQVRPAPAPVVPAIPAAAPPKTSPASFHVPAPNPSASCVRVTRHGNGSNDVGSGTVVIGWGGESYILTCHHVVSDGSRKITIEHDGKVYPATFYAADRGKDLCLLHVKGVELPWVYIAKAEAAPKSGEQLSQWGCCGDKGLTAKVGKFLGRISGAQINVPGGAPVQSTTIDARPGDSGCGLFNASGRLVAVCWGRDQGHPGQGCTGLEDIKRFLGLSSKDCTGCTDCGCAPGECKDGKCPAPKPVSYAPAAPLECQT